MFIFSMVIFIILDELMKGRIVFNEANDGLLDQESVFECHHLTSKVILTKN